MKNLNIFAVVLAWLLSIALVVMLVAAPLALSALSLLEPETIVKAVGEALLESDKTAAVQPREEIVLQNLSVETEVTTAEKPAEGNAVGGLMQGIRGVVGDNVSEETLIKVLTSDAMSDILGAYTEDLVNAVAGKNEEKEFTSELLVEVVRENLDEIVEIVEKNGVPLSAEQKEQLKSQIQSSVQSNADKIVASVPTPEEVKESLVNGDGDLALAFTILAKKNEIKAAIVGIIVALSALIFALRYPGLRGMRWIATNLFTGGGINVLICVTLGLASSAVKGVTAGMNAIEGTGMDGIIGILLSQLAKGVIVRTVIIFVAAVALLVGYILLKPFVKKKKAAKAEGPAVEEVIPEAVPAFVLAPVVEQEVMAEQPAESQESEVEETAEAPAEEI